MKKILLGITNRSSYSKYKPIITALVEHSNTVSTHLLLGGSLFLYKYGSSGESIRNDFPLLPVHLINLAVEGDDHEKMAKTVGVGCIEVATVFQNVKPDLVVVMADRFETTAISICASYMNIPLAHIQGGEVTGSIDDKVRWVNTMLADYHFPATKTAADRIVATKPQNLFDIYTYGCPSMDSMVRAAEITSTQLNNYLKQTGNGDVDVFKPYIVVIFHADTRCLREEVHRQAEILLAAVSQIDIQKVFLWSNIDTGTDIISKAIREHHICHPLDKLVRNIPPEYFGRLMGLSSCVVGNSSAGIRESSFLGVASVNVGDRQYNRDRSSNVVDCGFHVGDIVKAINDQVSVTYQPSQLYGDGKAGVKIADKLEEIVNG